MTFERLQSVVSELVDTQESSVADYLSLAKQLPGYAGRLPSYFRKIRVAFLSNFTLLGLPEVFQVRSLAHSIWADVYLAPYNQYAQEILHPQSGLYKFQPKLIYFVVDTIGADGNKINELADIVYKNGIAVKLIRDSAIKERFGDYWNTKYKELGDLRLAPEAFADFADQELMGEAVAVSGATKKCLVVDLDNTLWAGIVGESNYDEIKPACQLQKHILNLHERGVVLAVNSRNNYNDAISIVDDHPDMLLRRNHFTALRINWQDKASNMVELARELNLGLESFVFIDDDPFQRVNVKSRFPEIAVLPPEKLVGYPGFSSAALTQEDQRRGQMYTEENRRKEFQSSAGSLEDFLRGLDLKVKMSPPNAGNLARVSQLTQKTNQFNLATRRYSEKEVEYLAANGWKIWILRAEDKFGDYGIVGVCMVEPKADVWRIDNFLLSCRVLGRQIEKAFLGYVLDQARVASAVKIFGEFIPTDKNNPCRDFYPESGFSLTEEGSVLLYEYDLDRGYQMPNFMRIIS